MTNTQQDPDDSYTALSADLKAHLTAGGEASPTAIRGRLAETAKRLGASGHGDPSQLADAASYVERDMGEAATVLHQAESWQSSPTWLSLEQGFWQWLLELSDRTALEWQEVAQELRHGGEYLAGETVGIGVLTCARCGHTEVYDHPQAVAACIKCGATHFTRSPLQP